MSYKGGNVMKHTPGPWRYKEEADGTFGVEIDGGHSVYYELEGSCPQCFANMYLVAAAPELLEACEYGHNDATGWLWKVYGALADDAELQNQFREKMAMECAAIAKAKGET